MRNLPGEKDAIGKKTYYLNINFLIYVPKKGYKNTDLS